MTAWSAALEARCTGVIGELGEATTAEILGKLRADGMNVSASYLPHFLGALADRGLLAVTGAGNAGPRHPRRWRLAGDCPRDPGTDDLLPWARSRIVGRNAGRLREGANRRQGAVAAAVGITQGTLSGYESGRGRIPLARARALAEALGTTVEELAGEGGVM